MRTKTNPVKQKLCAGEPPFGSWLTLADVHSARVLARSGFEWLTLDLEHAADRLVAGGGDLRPGGRGGLRTAGRVPEGDHYCIKRALGRRGLRHRGADGRYRRAGPHGDRRGPLSAAG